MLKKGRSSYDLEKDRNRIGQTSTIQRRTRPWLTSASTASGRGLAQCPALSASHAGVSPALCLRASTATTAMACFELPPTSTSKATAAPPTYFAAAAAATNRPRRAGFTFTLSRCTHLSRCFCRVRVTVLSFASVASASETPLLVFVPDAWRAKSPASPTSRRLYISVHWRI